MKGDFSRIAHDRRKHYSRVLQQQGRVALDADHNDGAEIHHHLDRVTRRDVIGPSGVPSKGGAFALEPTPDGQDLFISEGRFYVDGLLVEVDSTWLPVDGVDAQAVRVPAWDVDGQPFRTGQWVELAAAGVPAGRMRVTGVDASSRKLTLGGNVAPYTAAGKEPRLRRVHTLRTQADAPDAAGAQLQPGSPLLLHLEVFERHVTEIEDPTLREVALGGPDTTTRVKTVWRLLTLPAGSAEDCASPVANWPPAPGNGRLTTTATATPKSDDPCVLPPEGGYRGVENRLYRVEIHKPGGVGVATYKWSRDNGAVAYAVDGFLPADGSSQVKTVRLRSLGRDRTLGLREGDWVEMTDDADELAGKAGVLATVEKVDLAERTVRLDVDVAAYQARDRRPKLRRWDMKAVGVTANGVTLTAEGVRIEASTDDLEDGVTVGFSGTDFRAGDWWAFAARVATSDVERLHARAPFNEPRLHARIALLTWEADPATGQQKPVLQDCRKPFDPLTQPCGCCCDVTVGDGKESFGDFTDLQKALDSIQHKGTVCVLKGTHKLKKTVTAKGGPLVIRSCGRSARILAPPGKPALAVDDSKGVTLDGLHVQADNPAAAVVATDTSELEVLACVLVNGDGATKAAAGPALDARAVKGVLVEDCDLHGKPALALEGREARIVGNRMTGGGVALLDACDDVRVEHNDVGPGQGDGVALGGRPAGSTASGAREKMSTITLRNNRIAGMGGNGVATRGPAGQADQPPRITNFLMADNDVVNCVRDAPQWTGKPGEAAGGVVLRRLERATIHANRVANNGFRRTRAVGILAQGVGIAVTDNLVEANGGVPEEDAGTAYDISFQDESPNTMNGPKREVDGVTFEVRDRSGQPAGSTRVVSWGGHQGLDCGFGTRVTFPSPAGGLTVKVGAFHSPVKVQARSPSGQTEERTTRLQNQAEELSFSILVERLDIVAPNDETLLMALEAEGASPQPLQGGIFVLGPESVHGYGTKEEDQPDAPKEGPPSSAPKAPAGEVTTANGPTAPPQDAQPMTPTEKKALEAGHGGKPAVVSTWPPGEDVSVHDNVVATPRGPSLVVVTDGPVTAQDNVLSTRGVALHGDRLLDVALGVVVASFPAAIFAPAGGAGGGSGGNATLKRNVSNDSLASGNARVGWYDMSDRRVLFRGNQASMEDRDAAVDRCLASFVSADEVLMDGNQFRHDLGQRHVSVAVRAFAVTLQARGNRFFELPLQVDFSLEAIGFSGLVVHNVAMHCIRTRGALVADQNVVQMRSEADCKDLDAQD